MDLRLFLENDHNINANDVRVMRMQVFDDAIVSLAEAEGMFDLNDAIEDTCAEWDEFFVEALTDYTVNQAHPRGYVDHNIAQWLIRKISFDGRVKSDTELELLVKIIERADSVPTELAGFALKAVANAVIEGNGDLLRDERLTPGVIGKPEAQLIRRIMYGVGADGAVKISRDEVEVLFDLNDATIEAENHPEWNDVFVKAVAAHLMMATGYQQLSRQEILQRHEWLEDTEVDVFGMMSKTLSSIGDLFSGNIAYDGASDPMQEAWRRRNAQVEEANALANPVDHAEAVWLKERIGRDGVLHENERALLAFLKEERGEIDPLLNELLAKVA